MAWFSEWSVLFLFSVIWLDYEGLVFVDIECVRFHHNCFSNILEMFYGTFDVLNGF